MSRYVDGFVLPVPRSKLAAYRRLASAAGRMWRKHGALQYFECAGDDLNPKMPMPFLPFPRTVRAKPSETVVFSFIVFRSRAHRDAVNKRVMKDMDKLMAKYKDKPLPFDMKRTAYGGFRTIVKA